MPRLTVLVPIFNDWDCISPLITGLDATPGLPAERALVIVDDGSTTEMPPDLGSGFHSVEVIRLGANLGHQRAIAVGLVTLAQSNSKTSVIVMDADGEDLPSDCEFLWQTHVDNPSAVVVAQRLKRSEGVRFKFFHSLYRWIFRVLTGRKLDFGNFSLLSDCTLQRVVLMPELWNHYPATIMKSRVEIIRVPLDRSSRFAGQSRMNFISLVNHGLAGIAAFADTAYARLLAWSVTAMGILGAAIVAGIAYRLTSDNPLPGWLALGATAAVIALFQIIAALIVVSFLNLSLRAHPNLPPTAVASAYISEIIDLQSKLTLESNE